jgi:hypothetical protein
MKVVDQQTGEDLTKKPQAQSAPEAAPDGGGQQQAGA